jgi:hypothetical protein
MEVLSILAVGALCIGCFLIGARVGQSVAKGERVEMPTINPMQVVRDQRAKREAEIEQGRMDKILQNIEAYDGTSRGQQDVPGR